MEKNKKSKIAKNTKKANDGFANIAKGIGGKKDTLQNTDFKRISIDLAKNYNLAEELYLFNWLVGNIADIPAEEATREWCVLHSLKHQDKIKKINTLFENLEVKDKISTNLSFADLFGGCALYMVVNDGRLQSQPLNLSTIKQGSFQGLRVLEPTFLTPLDDGLSEPEFYQLLDPAGDSFIIHKSRLIIFRGLKLTTNKKREYRYWGGSKVQRSLEPIIGSDTAINAIVNMLTEHNVNVYKLDGLTDLAIDNQDEDAIKRIQIIDTMKSYLNALVLDSKDDFIKRTNDFKDLHQIDTSTLIRVAGSAQIPATLLFGKSPDGQNATGASDFRAFYNRIRKIQTNKIQPALRKLISIASLSLFGMDILEEVTIEWLPLEQETKSEIAERENKEASTIDTYYSNGQGIITKDEARKVLKNSNPKFSFLEVEDQEESNQNEK